MKGLFVIILYKTKSQISIDTIKNVESLHVFVVYMVEKTVHVDNELNNFKQSMWKQNARAEWRKKLSYYTCVLRLRS